MSSWKQREQYLVQVAQRCLQGHKTFDLYRSHLVNASQISKGTIYNHFTTEADLILAVSCCEYEYWLGLAKQDLKEHQDPLTCFLYHHCNRLYYTLSEKRFVVDRVMPNQDLLNQANELLRLRFETLYEEYVSLNKRMILDIGEVAGFDRVELVMNYLRGAMINSDDADKHFGDVQLYYQFSYALSQLMGHSDRRIPTKLAFAAWLSAKHREKHQVTIINSAA
ncbi:TetR family transcriptional regulator [Shewanella woodyi]|uniref:Putative transcriptional regulator, TetR family n=1 Tax=Shewanella woodyi (strain ATCC 51908 / MS32) TaxID=392500 RepID=B1KN83_SHEWM|nr:TetR family transcriptional regulator [Shewanella woodyi]ACA84580.1 putative transcriptional regulator, TetR family [Shewanella woodyi ATCC 51908]